MVTLARGNVVDRPWGRTFAALGLRGLSGQLTVVADGKRFPVAFQRGAVVAAVSPLASDAAVRVALTTHLISSTQVADIARRQAAAPRRDEIELIAELARLSPEQGMRLRRRVVAQRAARTFSIERGDFVVEDQIAIDVVPGAELDVRAVVYLGARHNLSEQRLATELSQFGAWFMIRPDALADLSQFGFGDDERAVIETLLKGAGLAELEGCAPGVEQRMVRAVVYALAACNACEIEQRAKLSARPQTIPPLPPPPVARGIPKPTQPPTRATTRPPPAPPPPSEALDMPTFIRPPRSEEIQTLRMAPVLDAPTIPGRNPKAPRAPEPKEPVVAAQIEALIAARAKLVDDHADHFTMLGVTQFASAEEIRKAYFALARQLHPDRLSALGIPDEQRRAQRLFAQVNTAFAILSNPARRQDYTAVLKRGGEAAVRAEDAKAAQMAERILDAEEAFRRGEMAMRRDQIAAAIAEFSRALELNPDESDYSALLAWAQFCNAPDKMAAAQPTRRALQHAILRSPKAVAGRFYLGRVERMLGRDQDALQHFQTVLQLAPNHVDATSEVRYLEARLGAGQRSKR